MDQTTKDKLVVNVTNSWKMLSVQFMAAVTAIWTAYVALPAVCTPEVVDCFSQESVKALIRPLLTWVPAPLLTVIVGAIGYFARIKPQKGITPEVAAAKSADAPQPIDFPLETGPAPLPPIRGD